LPEWVPLERHLQRVGVHSQPAADDPMRAFQAELGALEERPRTPEYV
jgi:hypothetical protein